MKFLSIAEVAAQLKTSQREVADAVRLNRIPCQRVDSYRRIDPRDLPAIRAAIGNAHSRRTPFDRLRDALALMPGAAAGSGKALENGAG